MKKVMSIVLTVLMILSTSQVTFATNNDDLDTEKSSYLVYDVETGEKTSHFFDDLPETTSQSSPGYFPNPETKALIGGEGSLPRVTNTAQGPYCNTVYLDVDGSTFTGFMIGPSAVVTAGHCVINAYNNGFNSFRAIPAKNGTIEPYGSTTVTKIVIPKYVQSGPVSDDWAILELSDPIGNQTGWLGLKWQSWSYDGTKVWSTGYADRGTVSSQISGDSYMYVGNGTVRATFSDRIQGDWSAVSGFSGGPVYAYYSDLGYTAIGILTGGGVDGGSYSSSVYTHATRITKDMYNLFMTYR